MEIHRASASAMHIPGQGHRLHQPSLDRHGRTASHTSLSSSHSRVPMAIPGVRPEEPPPPLPPPRYNEELDRGVDTAWTWQNRDSFGQPSLAPVKPDSSLYGGYLQFRGHTPFCSEPDEMDVDDWGRRDSAVLAFRAPSSHGSMQSGSGTAAHRWGSRSALVGRRPSPAPSSQRLQGEQPLAQQNFDRSSQAYDQQLLSKIGKPSSPPRHSPSDSTDSGHLTRKLSLQTREPKPAATELATVSSDPLPRWVPSPVSGALSPCARPNWRDYLDHRSPSHDSTSPSLHLEPEPFVAGRTGGGKAGGGPAGSKPGHIDGYSSPTGLSQAASYDSGLPFADVDHDLPGEEGAAGSRRFHLNVQQLHSEAKPSRQGMKRRAPSPPAEVARDDKARVHPTEPYQRTLSGASLSRSPVPQHHSIPAYGSVSSTASSSRPYSSHPSSFAPSITGSSLTSASSLERQSPPDPAAAAAAAQPAVGLFITSSHLVASPVTSSAMPPRKLSAQQSPSEAPSDASRKMSIQSAINDPSPPPQPQQQPRPPLAAARTGAHYLCDCCPKKPRNFTTEEELRAHQLEKQYSCQYCNNRFKNKNEAERHQNSLHLRRHSWSCAAIPSYQAAFHPSSSSATNAAGSATDACGFCGEEFPNHPQPDWERRVAHLTNVHKFGECNQAKKFYRADHFRQHLKHSHAGQSGKWTNMLESVCLREEQPAEAVSTSSTDADAAR